ncbi:MAG: hypothetical protein A2741_01575 [Candidatus Zambryskibacteria bacterium RIFCSPHIGHO2_01_FULL_43_27]|uniref:Sigma-54 factor interaction domain-containing protein n=1 Tax=Candidatus Zambryskibacteria bacterium RIFCSPLOWO2_01_FULL_43_17 TaxID=1802760 RepID=A0A1G2U484_9BACT|nr:MAG: hypothetical protein A2741_01575 [Candidatus Zambryskibacteria bacterium RIFCSPHIGHO2_01_FULL_43_27]OHA99472.1 MAG: hypothetical protein A3E93_02740 [Candidatus Zambryskibacteria bacterium RIFCSPHIGHO2_12_FULL_43_12b]OHB04313.1 MAG: hypothetical protein A2920_03330 [Candidatus Zambryskibacteria bacterium RIFCSPLOWO2_01_FULL_43_17]
MTLPDLKIELKSWRAVSFLDKTFPFVYRKFAMKLVLLLLVASFAMASGIFVDTTEDMTGIFFVLLSIWLVLLALDAFFYSKFLSLSGEGDNSAELASIVFTLSSTDVTKSFIDSAYGRQSLNRSGINGHALSDFLSGRKLYIKDTLLSVRDSTDKDVSLFEAVIRADKEFENFLLAHKVNAELLAGAFQWVAGLRRRAIHSDMWWKYERLARYEPIGRSWAYGAAYNLERFSTPLRYSALQEEEVHPKEVMTLETLLSKSADANVIIVGEEGSGKMEIIEGLARRIDRGLCTRALTDMKFQVLNTDSILSYHESKTGFERALISIFDDVIKSGNIILVIPDIEALLHGALALGVEASSLIAKYLSSPAFHVVAVSDTVSFHRTLEHDDELMQHFEVILIKGASREEVSSILLERVIGLESEEGVYFTYPAVREAVESAGRYFVDSPLYDTAGDLLVEASSFARSSGERVILDDDVLKVVKTRTGVPTGELEDAERMKLTKLEELLHERIIGQNEAVSMVSAALRRARSGISADNRPMGTFLFLGPTGVGKTETTKALAEIFFGQDAKVLRLDMSEYSTSDALNRLIGGYSDDTPGVLASLIRENPYGVLLLDEFEKTTGSVLDLFLQILDEGIFSDATGRKVSARNLLIVATSNAGSDLIFEAVQRGEDLMKKKDEIVESIVQRDIFKPELLNRFDGVVLFHPLKDEHLREIAKILLKRLQWRLKEKGMTLEVNEALLDFLVKEGSDPKFGARPLNRAIQDKVEKIIADKIISGEYRHGSHIALAETDLI